MKKDRGFISLIIVIILALGALKYFFNWSIFDALESEEGQGTVSYIRDVLNTAWKYIGPPLMWLNTEIAWPLLNMIWQGIQSLIAGRNSAN